jgi:glucose/mannose-6-phosphate isomerase
MKKVLDSFVTQIQDSYDKDLPTNIVSCLKNPVKKIFVCGMGGSSISGQIIEYYLKHIRKPVPIFNVQNYDLPPYADDSSLIFIASYSGNTEESISCYSQAIKNRLQVIVITSGGYLQDLAKKDNTPYISIPKGLQPRNALAYLFFPMLKVIERIGIIGSQKEYINELIALLKRDHSKDNIFAKSLASRIYGKIIIIYSSEIFSPVAYRWKCEFNENAKIASFYNIFPELDHNEINSYQNFKKLKTRFHIIFLNNSDDHERIIKRMKITKKLISDMTADKISMTDITIKGKSMLAKIFKTIYLGELVSYYLSIDYTTDPTPVVIIEKLKKEMGHWSVQH